jgi:uncharacterized membrane protein
MPRTDSERWGRLADGVARFLGTWSFMGYMSLVIAAWLIWNLVAPSGLHFDSYANKFTLLTLILSIQASYAAPLILLAQNRQADRDRVDTETDRARSERNIDDTEYLTREVAALRIAVGEVATRDFVRSELSRLLDELDERQQADDTGEERAAS